MQKRSFFSIIIFSLILFSFSSILVSCAQDSDAEQASISFYMSSKTARAIVNRNAEVSKHYPAENEDESAVTLKIKLNCNGTPKEQSLSEQENGFSATFTDLTVGSRAYAEAEIYVDDERIAYGKSDEITIAAGNNTIKIRLTGDDGDGLAGTGKGKLEFDIVRYNLKKNTTLSSARIYQNYGDLVFSLIDDEDNDLFADIDWTNSQNASVIETIYMVKYRNTDVTEYFTRKPNKITPKATKALENLGIYQVSVIITPNADTYKNTAGETVELPDFEPVSGTFNITIEEGLFVNVEDYYDLGENATYESFPPSQIQQLGGYHTYNTLMIGLADLFDRLQYQNSINLTMFGTTDLSYTDMMTGVMTAVTFFSPSEFNIDMSGVTTQVESKVMGLGTALASLVGTCDNLKSLIIPDDTTNIGTAAFEDSSITSIKFGSALTRINSGAFYNSALETVTFAENNRLKIIGSSAFTQTSLEEFVIPASVIAIGSMAFYRMNGTDAEGLSFADTSGTWYYTGNGEVVGETQWETWISGTQTPPDKLANSTIGEVEDILTTVKNSTSGNVYWYCVKD